MREVNLYTDGACSGNPGKGGYGIILSYGAREKELSQTLANLERIWDEYDVYEKRVDE